MNKAVLAGRLTKDVDLRFTTEGKAVANFTLAVNRFYDREKADFIPVVVWGKTAENCDRYVGKGSRVAISGRIQTRSYEDKNGITRYITEIVADEVEFLEKSNTKETTFENDMEAEMEIDDMQAFLRDHAMDSPF